MSWTKKGFADAPEDAPKQNYVNRFRLPQPKGKIKPSIKKANRLIILTEGEPQGVWEHAIWIGDRKYHYTSLAKHDISSYDPLDALAQLYKSGKLKFSGKYAPVTPAYYGMMYTALDLTPWEDKKGNVHKVTKTLVVVKQQQVGNFELMHEKCNGDLRGSEWRVMRIGGDTSPQIGDWWDYQKTWSEARLQSKFEDYLSDEPELLKPFDIETLLEPKSVEELEKAAIAVAGRKVIDKLRPDWYVPESSDDDDADGEDDDDDEKPRPRRKPKTKVKSKVKSKKPRPDKAPKRKKKRPASKGGSVPF